MAKAPLIFTYYIAAPVEKVWTGFVSKEANQKIFMGSPIFPSHSARWHEV
jgi:uncharacterized protein YndB with AHSA1/START domain